MPCGAGKTQTGLELVSRIGGKTLWLTHTQDLLNQSMNRAKSVFGCPLSAYGTITEGKVNISEGITFATVQTMAKIDLAQYANEWDVVIVDECHKAVGSPTKVMQFYKVLSNLSARYKYGLTATPKRSDGLEKSMFALLGNVCATVTRNQVNDTTCPVEVRKVHTGYSPEYELVISGDGTINYAQLVDELINDRDRRDFVMSVLNRCKGATMVLANRVSYLEDLSSLYNKTGKKSICLSTLGNSKSAKAQRKESLIQLNAERIDCIFATYQLAKEGLDVPNLRYLVLATPEKDETTIIQSVGRVARKFEGKTMGIVYDIVDSFGMYRSWAKKREAYYKKIGVAYIDMN
jgi:superfamily II DNA or RNA helicase